MANETLVLQVKLEDLGATIKEGNKDLKDYRSTFDALQKDIAKAGSKPKSSWKNAAMGNTEYDIARGSAGATGASGRDFANQARGLDGLVRLYATYAANLFAAGAAFRALSTAADTSNMVQGLDQLGASSGKALGTLSKNLADAAEGAISLRDSMTAVAQSSSAGMSSANILRMGDVAKKASQALGISMPDALSRLSRGITKLEPELLDELGIFTKINDSNEQYARQLGKSAHALTDFEKRQGFANAVLKEAEGKFGKIKIDVNPYDKLLASLSNLSFKGLELINVVLGPLVKLLSESPLALMAVMAGLTKMIVSQAIPAIGQWRESLKSAADQALVSVAGRSSAAKSALTQRLVQTRIDAEAIAEVEVKARDEATARLETLSQQKFSQTHKNVKRILDKPVLDVTPADLKYLNDHAEMNDKTNKKLAASYREVAEVITAGQIAERKYIVADSALQEAKKKLAEGGTSSLKDDIKYRELSQQALMKNITATAAANAKELGYLASLRTGYADLIKAKQGAVLDVMVPGKFVKDPKTGKDLKIDGQKVPLTEKVAVEGINNLQVAQGALGVVTGATVSKLSSFISKLGTVGMVLGLVVGVFEIFNTMFSHSEKQLAEYNKASDATSAAIDNIGKTLDNIRNKSTDQILSIESVQARANAFNELNDTLAKSAKAFETLGKSQNWWDRSVEGTQRFFSAITGGFSEKLIGGGARKTMSDNLGDSIVAAIKATESGPARDKITKELSSLVGFDASTLDSKGLKEALSRLDFTDLENKTNSASKIINKFSHDANNNASTLTALQESLKQTGKDVDALTSSLTPNDPLGKIGIDLIANSNKINQALKDPTNGILALKAAVDDPKFLSLLPAETSADLTQAKIEIDKISEALGTAREKALDARKELQRLKDKGLNTAGQQQAVKTQDSILADVEKRGQEVAAKYSQKLSVATFQASFTYLEASLKYAMQEGGIAAAKGYVAALSGAGANTAMLEKGLRDQEFSIQRQLIDAQYAAKEAQERNTIALEKSNLLSELRTQTDKVIASAPGSEAFKEAQTKLTEITKNIIINENKSKILQNPTLGNIRKLKNASINPGEEDLMQTAAGQMSGYIATLYGKQAQLAKIAGQQQASNIQAMAENYSKLAIQANKKLDSDIKSDNIALSEITNQQVLLGFYDEELAKKKQDLDISILRNTAKKEENTIQANINVLNELAGKFAITKNTTDKDKPKLLEEEQKRTEALIQAEKDKAAVTKKALTDEKLLILNNSIAAINGKEVIAKREREYQAEIAGYTKSVNDSRLTQQEDELNYRSQLGLVTSFQAAEEKASIDRTKQKADYEQQLLSIKNKQLELDAKQKIIDALKLAGTDPKELIKQQEEETNKLKGQKSVLDAVNTQRNNAIDLTEQLASKMTGFSKIVENSFQGMADALADFVKTGKLDFKGLVDQMLLDLIRFELRAQMSSLYAGAGGLGGMLGSLFAKPTGMGASPDGFNVGNNLLVQAKGGVYDAGLTTFAKGGMFTNSVVSQPTLFKFAQGTGLMGEAGPEAIMPLKRDNNGNLGVRSGNQGGNVDVVVNNYGNEKATTKETTDSRGNRRIEVVVGDMVAGELARPGSSVQQSLTSSFNNKPALARR